MFLSLRILLKVCEAAITLEIFLKTPPPFSMIEMLLLFKLSMRKISAPVEWRFIIVNIHKYKTGCLFLCRTTSLFIS